MINILVGEGMRCLLQRNFHTAVKRDVKGTLLAETYSADIEGEIIARLFVEENSFDITEACLEEHRLTSSGMVTSINPLVGIKAYLGSGPDVKKALHGICNLETAELFAETIRAVVQAETFLLSERGYESPAAYSRYWEEMYKGSCRYYSNLERVERHWDSYVSTGEREGYLFTRTKNYFLYEETPGTYLVCGGLSDSFHEMNLSLKVRNGRIVSANGDIIRVPDCVCGETTAFLKNMVDMDIVNGSKKELSGKLGKGQGCVHLIDIAYDSVKMVAEYHRTHLKNKTKHVLPSGSGC